MERLVLLKQMYDEGFINEQEYNHRKTQIINEITNTSSTTTTTQTVNVQQPPLQQVISLQSDNSSNLLDSDAIMIDGFVEEDLNLSDLQLPIQSNPDNMFDTDIFLQDVSTPKKWEDIDYFVHEPTLTYEQKQEIITTLSRLSHESQLKVLQLLQSKTPGNITEDDKQDEYTCDLSQVDEQTCIVLYDTVKELEALELFEQQKQEQAKHAELSASLKRKLMDEDTSAMESTDEEDNQPKKKQKRNDFVQPTATVLASPIDLKQIDWFGTGANQSDKPVDDGKSKKFTITIEVIRIQKKNDGSSKPYECDVCHKEFKDRSNLVKHIRVHTKERPFECKVCGNRYAHSQTLKDHMYTHQQVDDADKARPFGCTFEGCSKSFTNEANLRRHMRIHTKEQPYSCHMCNKSFSQSGNLKTHLKIVHKVVVDKVSKNSDKVSSVPPSDEL